MGRTALSGTVHPVQPRKPIPTTQRPALPQHPYDVIIIGGGVNGVAIARECAFAGKRTLLLEQNDFASGTSSRATRIIHGGLRYLEHAELGLVRESLRERELLLRTKPNLVRPKQFVLIMPKDEPLFSLRNPAAVRVGLALYRRLAGRTSQRRSASVDLRRIESSLDAGVAWSLFDYEDAQCEFPERLIADWLVETVAAGAVARNHTEVLNVETAQGRATGVRVRDGFTKEESHFSATWIINATGPWADRVTEASSINAGRMIGGVRGSHIVLPRMSSATEAAIYAEAVDGRPIFIVPWNGQTLVGTTEVADEADPARTTPTANEVDYLLNSFRKLFPGSAFTATDISYCMAGVRPLPYTGSTNASATTRRHFIHDHSDDGARGMLSIIGGKLTTATSLARECASAVGIKPTDPTPQLLVNETLRADDPVSTWHGTVAAAKIRRKASDDKTWNEPLCSHSPHIVAEAVHAVRNEMALKLGDILLRRVPVALSASWSRECTRTASQRIGRALSWSEAQVESAADDFDSERRRFLRKPSEFA